MKIDDLKPAPFNPRRISLEALDGLRASLRELGDISGITWNKRTGHLVCGHQRVEALRREFGKALIMDGEEIRTPRGDVFRVRVVDWDEAKERLANVTANSPEIAGTWNEHITDLLDQVQIDFPDLSKDVRIDELLASIKADMGEVERPGKCDPDEVPEAPGEAKVKMGELWTMGGVKGHKLLCGDSTKAEDVARVMGGEKAVCVFTDPPYMIMGSSSGVKSDPNISLPFFRGAWRAIRASGAIEVYICCDWRSYPSLHQTCVGYDIKDVIVWDKQSGGLGNPYRRRHEFILFARPAESDTKMLKSKAAIAAVSISDDDVWPCVRETEKDHNAQKPVAIASRGIGNSTAPGDAVFDAFLGSGTTLIACEQLDRRCFGIEIEPRYCDVILSRWAKFTGKDPVRSDGAKWFEVKEGR